MTAQFQSLSNSQICSRPSAAAEAPQNASPLLPPLQVPQEQRAQVGVCVATMFDWIDASDQTKEWLQYTRTLGVDGRFHMYLTRQEIKFEEEGAHRLAWWRPRKAEPSHDVPGVDWVHVDAFNWTHTCAPSVLYKLVSCAASVGRWHGLSSVLDVRLG